MTKRKPAVRDATARLAFRLTQAHADAILASRIKGPLRDHVQRHRTKWLPTASSVTTIPLTEADHQLLGGHLVPA